ncbi:DNA mismatch repair protein msh6 [Nowakowskiella sp. JEL0407]|nr:DNA mismatch repair protein msh6 [Nowakowskiella sp. JEL0407]
MSTPKKRTPKKTPTKKLTQKSITSFFSSSTPKGSPFTNRLKAISDSQAPVASHQSKDVVDITMESSSSKNDSLDRMFDDENEVIHTTPSKRINFVISDDEDTEMTSPSKNVTPKKRKSEFEQPTTPKKIIMETTPKRGSANQKPTSPWTPKFPANSGVPKSQQEKRKDSAVEKKKNNDERYAWLLNIKDEKGNSPGDSDYDPRTLYIPESAFNNFTEFERQYWTIKCKHWDTLVFFKKGKFYELYERDADIGHQQFDLKLTDRTNMKLVGVPEKFFAHWASQFIVKGYKVAKVDQMENAVGKSK